MARQAGSEAEAGAEAGAGQRGGDGFVLAAPSVRKENVKLVHDWSTKSL